MTDSEQSAGKPEKEKLPGPEAFFLHIPLYRIFDQGHLDGEDPEAIRVLAIEFFDGSVKTYCIECGEESIFRTDRIQSGELYLPIRSPHVVNLTKREPDGSKTRPCKTLKEVLSMGNAAGHYALSDHFFTVEFYCTQDHKHRICFSFAVRNKMVAKVGQYPSYSDLTSGDVAKYRKVLGDERYREFTRAINLYSHDIGIGSYAYLRRIFESFIDEAHKKAIASGKWEDEDFERKRMEEKILSLQAYLPFAVVKYRKIYSILSKGLHELSEKLCLDHFDTLRTGIEMILEEQIAEKEMKKKEEFLDKGIAQIHAET